MNTEKRTEVYECFNVASDGLLEEMPPIPGIGKPESRFRGKVHIINGIACCCAGYLEIKGMANTIELRGPVTMKMTSTPLREHILDLNYHIPIDTENHPFTSEMHPHPHP
jgi:hypothetical protein